MPLRVSDSSRPKLPSIVGVVWRCLVVTLLCCGLSGCSLMGVRGESKQFYASTSLVGRVSGAASWTGPVVVVAYARDHGRIQIVHHTFLHEAGGYELIVPKGSYELFAFGDSNGNQRYDPGEPAGHYTHGPVVVAEDGVISSLDIAMSVDGGGELGRAIGDALARQTTPKRWSTQVGAIVNLDDELFSEQYCHKGYWQPMEFYREVGGNVYFLEPYDPNRIPVLFIHGAGGSPRDWSWFVQHLDRKRYQAWVYYYPSGASVETMAHLLCWKLTNLQTKYHFQRMYITAHSMGGLVARTFLANHGDVFPYVKLFVSISTPWGGDERAEVGVKHSPAVVPSWKDLSPSGRFMQDLYVRKLPQGADYYLFFGHRGHHELFRANSDGTITLSSQLRPSAQEEAKMVCGFDEDHTSILQSPTVWAQYSTILQAADRSAGSAATGSTGRLRVEYSYEQSEQTAKAPLVLILTPSQGAGAPIMMPVEPGESGSEFGPFPAGAYQVSLMANAFQTQPAQISVAIGASAAAASFRLVPQGTLNGYVGADVDPANRPAGSYQPANSHIRIGSITLCGQGETRRLVPVQEQISSGIKHYLAGQDYACGSYFSFVALPKGQYELTIEAEGYEPYKGSYIVIPGQYGYFTPITMKPKQSARR